MWEYRRPSERGKGEACSLCVCARVHMGRRRRKRREADGEMSRAEEEEEEERMGAWKRLLIKKTSRRSVSEAPPTQLRLRPHKPCPPLSPPLRLTFSPREETVAAPPPPPPPSLQPWVAARLFRLEVGASSRGLARCRCCSYAERHSLGPLRIALD